MPTVYFIVCHSGTAPANVVRFFTHKKYSHVCYSPSADLAQLHTFGRIHTRFFIPGGYINGGINSEFYQVHPDTNLHILALDITPTQQALVHARLAPFSANPRFYKYGFINCVYQFLGFAHQRKRHYSCSQFVALLFEGILPFGKPPSLVQPMDFCTVGLPCLFEGTAKEYRALLAANTWCNTSET